MQYTKKTIFKVNIKGFSSLFIELLNGSIIKTTNTFFKSQQNHQKMGNIYIVHSYLFSTRNTHLKKRYK